MLNKWGQFRRIGNQGPATGPLPSASSITQRATWSDYKNEYHFRTQVVSRLSPTSYVGCLECFEGSSAWHGTHWQGSCPFLTCFNQISFTWGYVPTPEDSNAGNTDWRHSDPAQGSEQRFPNGSSSPNSSHRPTPFAFESSLSPCLRESSRDLCIALGPFFIRTRSLGVRECWPRKYLNLTQDDFLSLSLSLDLYILFSFPSFS